MSSSDEDSFGWTTASSGSVIMFSEDDHHNNAQKKATKRKIKEESFDNSVVEIPGNKKIKRDDSSCSSLSDVIKKETYSNTATPTAIKKKNINKYKSLSSTVVSNDEGISEVCELSISKRKSKKNKVFSIWDDTQLNEISEIDNKDITRSLDLSETSKDVSTKVEDPLVGKVDKKFKKRHKSENLINGSLKIKQENSNHTEHSQKFYKNIDAVEEEPRTNNLEKLFKKKHEYESLENISLKTKQINFKSAEISPKKKKKKILDIERSAFSQDYGRTDKTNMKTTLVKQEFINVTSVSDNTVKSNDDSTETENKTCEIRQRDRNRSSTENNHNIENVPSYDYKSHHLSKSNSVSLVNSEIKNLNDIESEESINIETDDSKSLSKNNMHSDKLKHLASTVSDEVTSEDQTTKSGKKMSKQEHENSKLLLQYIVKNKHLRPMKSKFAGNSFLTEDDDIWIMKCPIEINIKTLHDSDLIIENKCKLKVNNQTYQGILNDSKINVAMPFVDGDKFVVKNCVPKGVVRLRKKIPKPHFVQDTILDDNPHSIPLPETKVRHPLFGFDYKSYLKLPLYVSEKLQDLESTSSENYNNINRKKKKKKAKVEIEEQSDTKIKKHKVNDDGESNIVKTKKNKHKISAEEMWESEKAIEENLFNL